MMIGVDTNVLVRYLVQDDQAQFQRAATFLETTLSDLSPGFVSLVAIAELVWVLDRNYHYSSAAIADAVQILLQTDRLRLQSVTAVYAALTALREGRNSCADALIAALGKEAGCSHTVTTDRNAARFGAFQLI